MSAHLFAKLYIAISHTSVFTRYLYRSDDFCKAVFYLNLSHRVFPDGVLTMNFFNKGVFNDDVFNKGIFDDDVF